MRFAGLLSTVNEQKAQQTVPAALPTPAGLARFATSLREDAIYRRCVLGAFALALLAGGNAGAMARDLPGFIAVLWAVIAASMAIAAIEPQLFGNAVSARREARQRFDQTFAFLLVPATLLLVFRSGADAWLPLGISVAIAAVTYLLRGNIQLHGVVNGFLCVAAAPAATLWNPVDSQLERMGWFFLALALGAVFVWLARRYGFGAEGEELLELSSAVFLGRAATLAWVFAAAGVFHADGTTTNLPILLGIVLLVLDLIQDNEIHFARVLAGVLILQIGTLAWTPSPAGAVSSDSIFLFLLQPFASLGAAALLAWAGLRYYQASLLRQPRSTYRIAPLCVVPRLDRAQDHPVKIDAL
jgi:hypothetical protein